MTNRIDRADAWCILRTSGGRTLPLARSLQAAGIEAWTPIDIQRRRKPRGSKGHYERETAITPTFVFVRAGELDDIRSILRDPARDHPPFSIFQFHGRIPLIAESEIGSLRAAEDRARLRRLRSERKVIAAGTHVRLTKGGFAGMSGVVEEGNGKFAVVAFGGTWRVKIATFLLNEGGLEGEHVRKNAAA